MTVDIYAPEKNAKYGANTPIIYVSLYFLLLAFFIYLHSISEPKEEKVQQVIGSIDFAFKGIKQKQATSEPKELTGDELGLAVFHAQLKKVYETAIPLIESKINQAGDELQFVVPISQLFSNQSATLRNTRDALFSDAAMVLIKRSHAAPTDMEILIDAGEFLPTSAELKDNINAMRLSNLVESFLEGGVPARNIFIGMKSGQTNNVYFRFYLRSSTKRQFRDEDGG
ncbi:hypothetical protein [Sneathiella sp.]|jgi:hypothetical protein|uniref:hypothetical protein n=1 Tax=Sneathiella sp. TaxID=1964365 RepID=UPI0039E3C163